METLASVNETLITISERKSVRNYTGQKISDEAIDKILHAAMSAPTAMHFMPWSFIVITKNESLQSLAAGLPYAQMLTDAGTAIVVCALPEKAVLKKEIFAILDCACASENILLAAESMGLGAVWTAVYPDTNNMEFVRKELGIPDSVIPLNIIPVGYPAGEEQAKDKYIAANIHRERW